jgi:hypothetical protein
VLDDYTTAWKARDAKALAALFAEGRTVVPNACPPATDRAGVEACDAVANFVSSSEQQNRGAVSAVAQFAAHG